VKSFLAENIDLVFEISEKVRQAVGLDDTGDEAADGDEAAEVKDDSNVVDLREGGE
jgi:hypothetical protein